MGTRSHFWQSVRRAAGAASEALYGPREVRKAQTEAATPQSRNPNLPFGMVASMAGSLPGHYISDHFRELESCVEWVWAASTNKARQYAQATASVKTQGGVKKAFQSAPDAPDDDKTSNPNHPLIRLLKRPNPLTSGSIFLYQVGLQIELTGGAVIWERRNQLGLPRELWCLPRGWLFYQRPTADYPYGYWRVTPAHNRWSGWYGGPMGAVTQWDLDIRDTIQVGWPSPLYPGEFQSSLAACSRLIDVAAQTEDAVAARMRNSIMPSVILSIVTQNGQSLDPLVQAQIDQLKVQLNEFYAGASNAGKAIIGNNIGLEPVGQSMEELQGTESRKQAREFVLNVFGVPPSAIGAVEETSYAAFSAAMKAYTSLSIDPVLMIVGEQLSHRWQSIWPEIEVCYDARSYDDPTLSLQRSQQIMEAVQGGGATWNEWRVSMQMSRRDDCDDLVKPQPMGPDGMPADPSMGGMPGMDPGAMGGDDFGSLDLEPDLPSDTTTGFKRPDLSRAGGRAFSLNGTGAH